MAAHLASVPPLPDDPARFVLDARALMLSAGARARAAARAAHAADTRAVTPAAVLHAGAAAHRAARAAVSAAVARAAYVEAVARAATGSVPANERPDLPDMPGHCPNGTRRDWMAYRAS